MNKRRFVDSENRIDLDLTYICDRLIAMAIPCVEGALYRNDIREVSALSVFVGVPVGHSCVCLDVCALRLCVCVCVCVCVSISLPRLQDSSPRGITVRKPCTLALSSLHR